MSKLMTSKDLVVANREKILADLCSGKKLKDIALDIGCSRNWIGMILGGDPEFEAAKIAALESRLDEREGEVEKAEDMFGLVKAKELLTLARWKCETEGKKVWSKNVVAVAINVNTSAILDEDIYNIARNAVENE